MKNGYKLNNHDKLLKYLFLCFAYEMNKDRDRVIFQDPVWSDPETTFSIVMNRSRPVAFDYCCLCIDALGGDYKRECGPVTTIYTESQDQRDKIKTNFQSLFHNAQKRLGDLDDKTPQEFYLLQLHPTIKKIASNDSNHFVVLRAYTKDAVDLIVVHDVMKPWIDFERVREHYKISFEGGSVAEIKVIFYRIRTQKKFIRHLKQLGVKEAI